MKKILILAAGLIMASCGKEKENISVQLPAIPVKVAVAGAENADIGFTTSGKIEAANSAMLSTRMMGYVTKLNVKTGQKVTVGQLLVSINDNDLVAKKAQAQAGVAQAQAGYNNAKKDYDRFTILFNQQSATQKELDDMTTRFEMAKAGLSVAHQVLNEVNAQFKYANISAPFSGEVTGTFIKEGDMANPGMPLLSIEGGYRLQVITMVSEDVIATVKEGMPVLIDVKSNGITLKGNVSEISSSAKNTGGQYIVKIDIDKPGKEVLSGMYVSVHFKTGNTVNTPAAKNSTVTLPLNALVNQGQLTGVYTIGKGNTAILRWLRTGKTTGNEVEILSGLSAGEKYITIANGKLYNGAKVSLQ